jgi:hypothetical protein
MRMVATHKYSAESIKRLDRIHRSFLFCGIVVLVIAVVSVIPMSTGMAGGTGLLILVPLSLFGLYALATAARYSIPVWRRRSVRMLWGATVILPLLYLLQWPWLTLLLGWLYAAIAIGIPLWWFLRERKLARH